MLQVPDSSVAISGKGSAQAFHINGGKELSEQHGTEEEGPVKPAAPCVPQASSLSVAFASSSFAFPSSLQFAMGWS